MVRHKARGFRTISRILIVETRNFVWSPARHLRFFYYKKKTQGERERKKSGVGLIDSQSCVFSVEETFFFNHKSVKLMACGTSLCYGQVWWPGPPAV